MYFRCSACTIGGYALDERLGLEGRYSPHAQRLLCLAAGSWSFDLASQRLAEFCGLTVSDTTIRQVAQAHGAAMSRWQREEPSAVAGFRGAEGDIEFETDGTCVNTTDGWREMKVGLFAKRQRGEPAGAEQWATRPLPRPHVRVCFAAIEKSERFGARWKAWQRRLGIAESAEVAVLADGAKWIWEERRKHLTYAEGVLDVFHALEHVGETAKALHGETPAADEWTEAGRRALLTGGFRGIDRHIAESLAAARSARERRVLESLHDYLQPHEHHLDYSRRLAEGRSIGSGQVEGACKNLVGRRLKQTGVPWRPRRVNRMAGLCSLLYSDLWNTYWEQLAA